MDLKHLRTFSTVAELGSVSKAALRLRVAQPALSRQIIDLEKELGLKLFDRIGRRLLLTRRFAPQPPARMRMLRRRSSHRPPTTLCGSDLWSCS